MDELENIRKRAKQLVRDHRDGLITVAERIRRSLPRFADLTDAEVLDGPFTLSDAQRVLATELGLSSWEDLASMSDPPTPSRPAAVGHWRGFPQVFVRDIPAALAWYEHVLGFTIDYVYGSPAFHAQISRDGLAMNLRHTAAPPWGSPTPEPDLLAVRVEVDDVSSLYAEFRDSDAPLHQPLRREPWGQRTFIVQDLDWNLLSFGSHMPVVGHTQETP